MNKITPKDQEPKVGETKVEEPKMADTIAVAVENELVAIDPTLETDVTKLKIVDETADTLVAETSNGEIIEIDKESIVKEEDIDNCADHISRTKILDVIENTMARYKGKVVLAMEEVRDIIKAITTAVQE
jgi:hypothetical protein